MAVPSTGFHALLENAGLLADFQQFCCEEVWKGLCGRCSTLGDHFSDDCPKQKASLRASASGTTERGSGFFEHASSLRETKSYFSKENKPHFARDLRLFTKTFELSHLEQFFTRLRIDCLKDLQDPGILEKLREEVALSQHELRLLNSDSIESFKQKIISATRCILLTRMTTSQHFMFLSHYKVEAGTEASLMRQELEHLIGQDAGHPARSLEVAIFLDSEDLSDLEDLMNAVRRSHNLVLMLTKGVLTRPWCILEIVVAVRNNVNLIPVRITKPGAEFEFPDQSWYDQLLRGEILGEEGTALVNSHGILMEEVAAAVRKVLMRIALPYSPHRTGAIRRAEVEALLRQAGTRDVDGSMGQHASLGSPDASQAPAKHLYEGQKPLFWRSQRRFFHTPSSPLNQKRSRSNTPTSTNSQRQVIFEIDREVNAEAQASVSEPSIAIPTEHHEPSLVIHSAADLDESSKTTVSV